jgi:cell division protein FtsX
VRALRGAAGVADVVVDEPADGRLARALVAGRALAWTGAALLAGLAVIVVLAAVRVRLDRGHRELAVARLLGAGPGFLVVPTALAGALSGLVAAALAALGVGLGVHLHGEAYGGALIAHLAVPGATELAAFLAAGAVLGGLGGGLAGASRVAG